MVSVGLGPTQLGDATHSPRSSHSPKVPSVIAPTPSLGQRFWTAPCDLLPTLQGTALCCCCWGSSCHRESESPGPHPLAPFTSLSPVPRPFLLLTTPTTAHPRPPLDTGRLPNVDPFPTALLWSSTQRALSQVSHPLMTLKSVARSLHARPAH